MAKKRINPKTYLCIDCGTEANYHPGKKNIYCSIKCQQTAQYKRYVKEWKEGLRVGAGPNGVSVHIKRYLLEKQNHCCAICGTIEWNGKPLTLEVEHVDGNSQNQTEDNLAMICPNCHSQTETYKGKNRGNGRHFRKQRYLEGKSF